MNYAEDLIFDDFSDCGLDIPARVFVPRGWGISLQLERWWSVS